MDWDSHDRERPYPYERDRAGHDYGRRGRSRSPPPDEAGRKRRRSTSPYERERYEPRPRHNDDFDTHSRGYGGGGYSPRRGHAPPYPPNRRPPPDPHSFDYPATLKQYAEWFRFHYPTQATEEDNADKAAEQEAGDGSKPRNGIKTRWEKYKKEFAANQLQVMFDHHKKSPWFAEKYDPNPDFAALRTRVRKDGWKGRLNNFLLDLEAGKFDPDLNEPRDESMSPVKDTVNGESAENNAAPVAGDDSKPAGGDDDMQFNIDADEEPVDHDGARPEANGKGASNKKQDNRGDEIAVPPEGNQVMIRTIPPDIGRVKLEEACSKLPGFIYLALGDPLQKRNFYRAGWIRFRDDADMTAVMAELNEKKIDGFKLHVNHNMKPFVNRIRYAPEVASRPERLEKDLANAKKLASILEDEAGKLRATKVSTSKTENGTGTVDDQQTDAPMSAVETEDDDPEPKERGSDAVERRIEIAMAELRDQGLVNVNDEQAYDAKKTIVSLDLYLAYLRAAFNTCYYCSVTTDHVEELQRKCVRHLRKPPVEEQVKAVENRTDKDKSKDDNSADKPLEKEKKDNKTANDKKEGRNDDRWLEWLDSKIALLINRDGVDPRDYGGKSYEEELSKAVEAHIKQEDEGKFRCKTCQKLFKATTFVEKHIANKHAELVKQLDEIPYFNNFALDPHRIQPFAHPPPNAGTGNNQPPPQAFGIQPPAFQDHRNFYPPYGPYPPPPYHGGHWEYPYPPYMHMPMYPPQMPPRRDDNPGRRLSDRIGGFSLDPSLPQAAGLPPKPTPAALDQALSSGNNTGRRNNNNNSNSRNNGSGPAGPPPPPPPDAKEDPRAAAGKRVSYHDMDLVAEGDVELSY
ncbi:hypothetical protein FA15DRAFT_584107 [Coprinopsis marcescibilis]|uniref:C2H2-type domain-containing protein n=1 Tax=Coprinopsis marcescibilis TaxID=230819 RepID=A0A5C3L7Q2_COPMA|nr:hypothetical protein FA15DRAFT_584107 [Coprinopsis marcescibilis]